MTVDALLAGAIFPGHPSHLCFDLLLSMKKIFLPLVACGLASLPVLADPVGHVVYTEDFERLSSAARPASWEWNGFPPVEGDNKHNGIVGAEMALETGRNKVLRVYGPMGAGLDTTEQKPSFAIPLGEPLEADGTAVVSFSFDYRNLATASTWCRLGLRDSGSPEEVVAVFFNGSASDGMGGVYLHPKRSDRIFPDGKAGPLKVLRNRVWYHMRLDLNCAESTMKLTVEDSETKEVHTTNEVSLAGFQTKSFNQIFFDFPRVGGRANYRFELDNIKVEVR